MKTNVLYYGDNLDILRNREYFLDDRVNYIVLSDNYDILMGFEK